MAQEKSGGSDLTKGYDDGSGKMSMAFKPHSQQTGAAIWKQFHWVGEGAQK